MVAGKSVCLTGSAEITFALSRGTFFCIGRSPAQNDSNHNYLMKRTTVIFCAIPALLLSLTNVFGQAAAADPHATGLGIFAPADIKWVDGPPSLPPGAKMAILEGDPKKEGPFLIRLRVPDGYHVPPHTHPKTEHVTVLSGNFKIAMGDRLEASAARTLPAGTFGYWPAGMKHAVWIVGETVLQLHGTGPWAINYVNPADDPRNAKKSP
jgi:quercetin dioxygenase-like cupin family protein